MDTVTQQSIQRKYELLGEILDERGRRLWAAVSQLGRGGVATVARATGLSRTTIYQGLGELNQDQGCWHRERLRSPGGGRKRLTEKDPQMLTSLESLVEPATRGDSESPLRRGVRVN